MVYKTWKEYITCISKEYCVHTFSSILLYISASHIPWNESYYGDVMTVHTKSVVLILPWGMLYIYRYLCSFDVISGKHSSILSASFTHKNVRIPIGMDYN